MHTDKPYKGMKPRGVILKLHSDLTRDIIVTDYGYRFIIFTYFADDVGYTQMQSQLGNMLHLQHEKR